MSIKGTVAHKCEVCGEEDPHWALMRLGDAVVTWACDIHLVWILTRLQRDHEVTRIEVKDFRKAKEWADIQRSLERVAREQEH